MNYLKFILSMGSQSWFALNVCQLLSRNYLLRKSVALIVLALPCDGLAAKLCSSHTHVGPLLTHLSPQYHKLCAWSMSSNQHIRKPIQWAFLVTGATNSAEQLFWHRCGKCRYTPQQYVTRPYSNDIHPDSSTDPSPDPFSLLTQLRTMHIPLNKHLYHIKRAQSLLLHWGWGIGLLLFIMYCFCW